MRDALNLVSKDHFVAHLPIVVRRHCDLSVSVSHPPFIPPLHLPEIPRPHLAQARARSRASSSFLPGPSDQPMNGHLDRGPRGRDQNGGGGVHSSITRRLQSDGCYELVYQKW